MTWTNTHVKHVIHWNCISGLINEMTVTQYSTVRADRASSVDHTKASDTRVSRQEGTQGTLHFIAF